MSKSVLNIIESDSFPLRKLQSQLDVRAQLERLSPHYGQIDRRRGLSDEDFLKNYYSQNRPVVLTGAMKRWKALKLWGPEYFKKKLGYVEVEIMADRDTNKDCDIEIHKHKKKICFAEFVDKVFYGNKSTNDFYLVSNNYIFSNHEMRILLEDIELLPFLSYSRPEGHIAFWMGPNGTITSLHHDLRNVLFAQVLGTKKFKLISPLQTHLVYNHSGVFSEVDLAHPDYDRYPLLRNADIIELTIHPGELLFIPVGWWHYVESLEPSVSMSFANFLLPNEYDFKHP